MIAEIISIGDELTSGQRLDTNSRWLSEQLGELGITVMYHTTVGDDLAANVDVFQTAIKRADLVVASGGLGPTADDLTREAIALATATELSLDEQQLDHIRHLFASRGREMPPRNRLQAMFPLGSTPIRNPNGTAPGIAMAVHQEDSVVCRLFALPGVPAEMFEMWQQSVDPIIRKQIAQPQVIRHRRIKCFGIGESHLEQMLPDLIDRRREPRVGITVSQATITLRITANGRSDDECLAAMRPTEQTIRETLAEWVFGEEDDELQQVVLRHLQEKQKTLATVEWGTAGLVAQWLGAVSDRGEHYLGGLTIAAGGRLKTIFDFEPSQDESVPIDQETYVCRMARSCCDQFGADLGLAVGPRITGDVQAGQTDYFALALATEDSVVTRRISLAGHPEIVIPRAAKGALDLVRRVLLRLPIPGNAS